MALTSLLHRDLVPGFREQEALYPRSAELLKSADCKVVFFQGEWDNQTPVYHARAVEQMARGPWQKENFRFHFFPKLGHLLDRRDCYDDLAANPMSEAAKRKLASELDLFLR